MKTRLYRLHLHTRLAQAVAIIFSVFSVSIAAIVLPHSYATIQERGTDSLWQLTAARSTHEEKRVVIIDIDESSLAQEGAWPWPRARMAQLSQAIAEAGAQIQLFDIVFPEAKTDDTLLATQQHQTGLHVGQLLSLKADSGRVGELSGALSGGCHNLTPIAGGYIGNTAQLARSAGHITPIIDSDGVVRRIAPIICHQQRAYPALALQALASLTSPATHPSLSPGKTPLAPTAYLNLTPLGLHVPLDSDGTTRIPYNHQSRNFTSISASDLLANRHSPDVLKGVIALVGTTAFGLGDTVTTPSSSLTPGVEIHARLITAALDGQLPHTPNATLVLQGTYILVSAILLLLLAARSQRLYAYALPLAGLALGIGAYAIHAGLLLKLGLWVGWLAPAGFSLLAGIALSVAEIAGSRRERERLYQNLVSYLPRHAAEQLALHHPVGTIEAQRMHVTVLFADLRNASAYFESRPPEEVGTLLHAFFTTAHHAVSTHDGVVEEFVGDSIMAIWESRDTPHLACQKALAAAHDLVTTVESLFPSPPPPGLEPLGLGVGIETGMVLIGSFGAAERRTHAVLGETVSVAAKLQTMSVELASPIVLGEGFAANNQTAMLRDVGSFLLEGLQRPRRLFVPPPQVTKSQAFSPVFDKPTPGSTKKQARRGLRRVV